MCWNIITPQFSEGNWRLRISDKKKTTQLEGSKEGTELRLLITIAGHIVFFPVYHTWAV